MELSKSPEWLITMTISVRENLYWKARGRIVARREEYKYFLKETSKSLKINHK